MDTLDFSHIEIPEPALERFTKLAPRVHIFTAIFGKMLARDKAVDRILVVAADGDVAFGPERNAQDRCNHYSNSGCPSETSRPWVMCEDSAGTFHCNPHGAVGNAVHQSGQWNTEFSSQTCLEKCSQYGADYEVGTAGGGELIGDRQYCANTWCSAPQAWAAQNGNCLATVIQGGYGNLASAQERTLGAWPARPARGMQPWVAA